MRGIISSLQEWKSSSSKTGRRNQAENYVRWEKKGAFQFVPLQMPMSPAKKFPEEILPHLLERAQTPYCIMCIRGVFLTTLIWNVVYV